MLTVEQQVQETLYELTENNDDDMSWEECWQSIIDMAQKVMNYKDESNEMRKR